MPHQAEHGPDRGRAPRASQGDCTRWGGEIREGPIQEVAWEVGLRKRKDCRAKSVAVTAGRVQGQGRGREAGLECLGISWESWGVFGPVIHS